MTNPDPIDPEFKRTLADFMDGHDELLRRLKDDPDPIEAAIEAARESLSIIDWGDPQNRTIVIYAIRAAAPILIAHGREQAAKAMRAEIMKRSGNQELAEDASRACLGGESTFPDVCTTGGSDE